MFEKMETGIPGCFVITPRPLDDLRGRFVKIYHADLFRDLDLPADFREEYYSISRKHVVRGLHFQLPPHEHIKCVTCLHGALFDVVVDLRKDSPTYKQHFSIQLDDREAKLLYIPAGLAHGFCTLSEDALFLNKTTTVFNGESDTGIRWDSCGIEWPVSEPILSDKDKEMVPLAKFASPF